MTDDDEGDSDREPASSTGQPAKKKSPVVWIVLGVGCAVLIPILSALAALGIYGFRRYLAQSKTAEGRVNVASLARGVASCSETKGEVPLSSRRVPIALSMIQGKKYMSAPSDWRDAAFMCAGFSMVSPQYFQYRWVRLTSDVGQAWAIADLDGDGVADVALSAEVTCTGGACLVGPVVENASAPP